MVIARSVANEATPSGIKRRKSIHEMNETKQQIDNLQFIIMQLNLVLNMKAGNTQFNYM